MDQVSRPVLILLVATVALAGVWFVALRPKSPDAAPAPAPQAPGVTGLGNAVDKANGAVATSQASAQQHEQAAGETTPNAGTPPTSSGSTPPSGSQAAPKAPDPVKLIPGDKSGPILDAVGAGKVAVVLFYNRAGADDRATRLAVRAADRRGGKVKYFVTPISKVGDYDAITAGAKILEAPTLLVIAPDRTARTVVGLSDVVEINQLVDEAGHFPPIKLTGFAAKFNEMCRTSGFHIPSVRTTSDIVPTLQAIRVENRRMRHVLALVPASRLQKPLKRAMFGLADDGDVVLANGISSLAAPTMAKVDRFTKQADHLDAKYVPVLRRYHVSACL